MCERPGGVMTRVRCRSWWCDQCGLGRGVRLRVRFREICDDWADVVMVTLTVRRDWHEGPEAAYHYVQDGSYIPRLMAWMGIRRWVAVMEPQAESGEGWPHWHIMADFQGQWVDYRGVHERWRRWGIGEQIEISRERGQGLTPGQAVNYVTKYLVQPVKRGIPRWVLQSVKRVRRVSSSKAVGALVADREGEARGDSDDDGEAEARRSPRELVARMAECGRRWRMVYEGYYCEGWGDVGMVGRSAGGAVVEVVREDGRRWRAWSVPWASAERIADGGRWWDGVAEVAWREACASGAYLLAQWGLASVA